MATTALQRRERAAKAGYSVWASDWQDSSGGRGRSWVITRPDGDNMPDYVGSEAAGWREAYADLTASARTG